MKILKINSIKKKLNDNEKNLFKMKLINKIKITMSVIKNKTNS